MESDSNHTLSASVLPAGADDTTVTWSSSDTSVATITQAGVINAISEGTTTITVTTNSGSNITDSFNLTVANPLWDSEDKLWVIKNGDTVLHSNYNWVDWYRTYDPHNVIIRKETDYLYMTKEPSCGCCSSCNSLYAVLDKPIDLSEAKSIHIDWSASAYNSYAFARITKYGANDYTISSDYSHLVNVTGSGYVSSGWSRRTNTYSINSLNEVYFGIASANMSFNIYNLWFEK